jgi:flagellar protein FliO/FliZ
MHEMLELFLGETGAILVQFLIVLIGVLILVGAAYWLFKWFAGNSFSPMGTRRNPRLAIIDALSIDRQRKLILIRRDNVEHLILVGGSVDLVVETPIIRNTHPGGRQRQVPAQRSQPQQVGPSPVQSASAAEPPPHSTPRPSAAIEPRAAVTGLSEPIAFEQNTQPEEIADVAEAPFEMPDQERSVVADAAVPSQEDNQPASPAPKTAPANDGNGVSTQGSAHFEEPTRPSAVRSIFAQMNGASESADGPNPASNVAERADTQAAQVAMVAQNPAPAGVESNDGAAVDMTGQRGPTAEANDLAATDESSDAADIENAAKVSNLEQEMALLLGKISPKREV